MPIIIVLLWALSAITAPNVALAATPARVAAGQTFHVTIRATAPVVITIAHSPAVLLLNASPSVGTYQNGTWTITDTADTSPTLDLAFLVLPIAESDADLLIRAEENGYETSTGPSLAASPHYRIRLPLIYRAAID